MLFGIASSSGLLAEKREACGSGCRRRAEAEPRAGGLLARDARAPDGRARVQVSAATPA